MAAQSVLRIAAFAAALAHAAVAPAQGDGKAATLPTFAELEAAGAVIGRIRVNPQQIFDLDDPREDRWLYRLANRLHIRTRPEIIEQQLLFKPGEFVSLRVIEETERLLRSNNYLYDAQIRPVDYHDGVVDIEVITHDTWSLQPGASVARTGGANSGRLFLKENNLLGSGISAGIGYSSNVDRAGTEFSLQDKSLFGSRVTARASYANLTDGSQWAFGLDQPFYSPRRASTARRARTRFSAPLSARTSTATRTFRLL